MVEVILIGLRSLSLVLIIAVGWGGLHFIQQVVKLCALYEKTDTDGLGMEGLCVCGSIGTS